MHMISTVVTAELPSFTVMSYLGQNNQETSAGQNDKTKKINSSQCLTEGMWFI